MNTTRDDDRVEAVRKFAQRVLDNERLTTCDHLSTSKGDIVDLLDTARYAESVDDRVIAAASIIRQHSTLVAQRDRLLGALKGVAIMLNTQLTSYEDEPWAQRVRAAITTIEQEK